MELQKAIQGFLSAFFAWGAREGIVERNTSLIAYGYKGFFQGTLLVPCQVAS